MHLPGKKIMIVLDILGTETTSWGVEECKTLEGKGLILRGNLAVRLGCHHHPVSGE